MIIMVLPGFKSQRLGKYGSEVGSGLQPLGGSGAEPDPAPLGALGPVCRSESLWTSRNSDRFGLISKH